MGKRTLRIARILVGGICLALGACASDQTPTDNAAPADISGLWQFDYSYPDDTRANQLLKLAMISRPMQAPRCMFQQTGRDVAGTCRAAMGDAAVTGTVNGNKVRLDAHMPGLHWQIIGSLDSEATMKGILIRGPSFVAQKISHSQAVSAKGEATGFFVSPTLILTSRHFSQNDFSSSGCGAIKVVSSDGTLRGADLELVGYPPNNEVDLALFRLKSGSYPAAPVILHSFDGPPKSIAEPNAAILTYPNPILWNFDDDMAVVRKDAVVLLNYRDMAAEILLTIDEDGTIRKSRAGTVPPPTSQLIRLPPGSSKLLVLYSKALRPGASGAPIVDKAGRLMGVVKGEVRALSSEDLGVAVDSRDVGPFIESHGASASGDDQTIASRSPPDLSRNVVRLFCFGSGFVSGF